MFQFPALAPCNCTASGSKPDGLSHSEIPGSMVICTLPGLIAAYHVLHRLREPRHPPCALISLLYISYFQLMILSVKSIKIYSFLVCTNMSKIYICHRASVMTAPMRHGVENIGVEPMTSCLQSRRSSQLS